MYSIINRATQKRYFSTPQFYLDGPREDDRILRFLPYIRTVGLIAQLVEHCTGIMGSNPVQLSLNFFRYIYNCDDESEYMKIHIFELRRKQ